MSDAGADLVRACRLIRPGARRKRVPRGARTPTASEATRGAEAGATSSGSCDGGAPKDRQASAGDAGGRASDPPRGRACQPDQRERSSFATDNSTDPNKSGARKSRVLGTNNRARARAGAMPLRPRERSRMRPASTNCSWSCSRRRSRYVRRAREAPSALHMPRTTPSATSRGSMNARPCTHSHAQPDPRAAVAL
jgi:hypothetical protein